MSSDLSSSDLRYIYGLDDDLDDSGHFSKKAPTSELIRRVYRYRDDRYLVTFLPANAPKSVVDLPTSFGPPSPFKSHNNVVRAQSAIQALGFCNDWEWFITCTLSPELYPDRLALDVFRSNLVQLVRNIRRESGFPCRFLFVPELHKNEQGWHMHGLLQGFPDSCFRPFELSEHLPAYLLSKLAAGEQIYDFPRYRSSFGFVDVEPLRSRDHAVSYLCKYVVKGLSSSGKHISKGKHLYFCSRGLNRPQLVDESPQFSSSRVLEDLELDGLVPLFDKDISFEVDGCEKRIGFMVWYHVPQDPPSELHDSDPGYRSLSLLPDLHDSVSEGQRDRRR